MVDGLFFCATLTGRRGGHTPFVQTGAETPDTGVEAVKPDPCCSWEDHSWSVGTGVGDESTESRGVVRPLCVPLMIRPLCVPLMIRPLCVPLMIRPLCVSLMIRPLRRMYVVAVRETDELLCSRYKWVSRFEAPCNSTRWTDER